MVRLLVPRAGRKDQSQARGPSAGTRYRSGGAAEARIERVAEGVAEEVEREHREEDRDAGPGAHPPLQVRQVALRVVDVGSPRRNGRLRAEAEERERRLGKDGEGDRERRL